MDFVCPFFSKFIVLLSNAGPQDEIYTFIEFYAPWCSHCTSFAPTLNALSRVFKGQESPKVVIARMDIAQEKKFAKHYEITSLPTLRLFKGTEAIGVLPYIGRRTLDNMIEYLNHETGSNRKKDGLTGINSDTTCSMKE